jgi:hypothetical protein
MPVELAGNTANGHAVQPRVHVGRGSRGKVSSLFEVILRLTLCGSSA